MLIQPSATPPTSLAGAARLLLINLRATPRWGYWPAPSRSPPTSRTPSRHPLPGPIGRVQTRMLTGRSPLTSKKSTVHLHWLHQPTVMVLRTNPLTNWRCSRPHLPHRRSRTSFDFRFSFSSQSPRHSHRSSTKHGEYHRPHRLNHADHHPLLACHRYWAWRARSPRTSSTSPVSGWCEDQGRNT